MRVDKIIHTLCLTHRLPLSHDMQVVSIRVTDRKHGEGIIGDAWQRNKRTVMGGPHGVTRCRHLALAQDVDIYLDRRECSPAIAPSVARGVTGVQHELINHCAL